MLGILKIWKNNGTFRRPCHNWHGCAWHQMQKVTRSYELMIVVIMTVVGLGMITFMAHKEKNE